MTDRCSEKGCSAVVTARFIDPESAEHPERPRTEHPACWRDFWKRVDLDDPEVDDPDIHDEDDESLPADED